MVLLLQRCRLVMLEASHDIEGEGGHGLGGIEASQVRAVVQARAAERRVLEGACQLMLLLA